MGWLRDHKFKAGFGYGARPFIRDTDLEDMCYLTSLVSPQSCVAQSTAKTYHSGFWQALAPPSMAGSLGGLLEKGETNPAPLCQVNKSVGGKELFTS